MLPGVLYGWRCLIGDRWVESPRERQPYKCPFTNQDSAEDGPYFEARLFYFPAHDSGGKLTPGRHPHQLYLSPQAIREFCALPGSPVVAVTREAFDDILDERNRYEEMAANATAELEQAREEIEGYKKYAPEKVEDLIKVLDARYPKRRAKA